MSIEKSTEVLPHQNRVVGCDYCVHQHVCIFLDEFESLCEETPTFMKIEKTAIYRAIAQTCLHYSFLPEEEDGLDE